MLQDTKERALPLHVGQSVEDYLIYLKHVALYIFAQAYCANKRVLDLGSGEGYGSTVLADAARFVVCADYSIQALTHAKETYARANVAFVVCDAQALPFASAFFEQVVSFEVIEHIPDVSQYLKEIRRVSVNAGQIIISTPNRSLRLLPFQRPWNRFHLREYDARDLLREMQTVFASVQIAGITAIPKILAIEKRRVKQNPLTAYPKMIARIILPTTVYARWRILTHWLEKNRTALQPSVPAAGYSVNDFQVSQNNLDDCINLVTLIQL